MWTLIITLCTLQCALGGKLPESEKDDDRIINGWTSKIDQAPWLVSLQDRSTGQHFCGGTIIEDNWILTAAHCVNGRNWNSIRIQMGLNELNPTWLWSGQYAHSMQRTYVRYSTQIIKAPEFYIDSKGVAHDDVALIRLDRAITKFKNSNWPRIQTIDMWNHKERDYPNALKDYQVTIAGWGATSPNDLGTYSRVLKRGLSKLMSEQECKSECQKFAYSVGNDVMCAVINSQGQDICNGDSGSGIVYYQPNGKGYTQPYLIGVASGGIATCGTPRAPILMAEVAEFYDWILCKVWNFCR